jgi:hypothetical protein
MNLVDIRREILYPKFRVLHACPSTYYTIESLAVSLKTQHNTNI